MIRVRPDYGLGGGTLGGGCGGGDSFLQSGKKIHTPPVRVQVIPHARGTTVGVSLGAIRVAIIPATITGRMRREANFNAAIGSAMGFPLCWEPDPQV